MIGVGVARTNARRYRAVHIVRDDEYIQGIVNESDECMWIKLTRSKGKGVFVEARGTFNFLPDLMGALQPKSIYILSSGEQSFMIYFGTRNETHTVRITRERQ